MREIACSAVGSAIYRGVECDLLEGRGEVRDRFQGALLGLSLSSIRGSNFHRPNSSSPLAQAIGITTAQAKSCLSVSQTSRADSFSFFEAAFFLPASVPILLRHYNSWTRRLDRLPLAQLAPPQVSQILILGDLLEAAITGTLMNSYEAFRLSDWLAGCAARYRYWPVVYSRYGEIVTMLATHLDSKDSRSESLSESSGLNDLVTSAGIEPPISLVAGAIAALSCPESYWLAIASLEDDLDWSAPFVAGLLSGALNGRAAIPALWQMRANPLARSEMLALADGLFYLWAGMLSAVDLPSL